MTSWIGTTVEVCNSAVRNTPRPQWENFSGSAQVLTLLVDKLMPLPDLCILHLWHQNCCFNPAIVANTNADAFTANQPNHRKNTRDPPTRFSTRPIFFSLTHFCHLSRKVWKLVSFSPFADIFSYDWKKHMTELTLIFFGHLKINLGQWPEKLQTRIFNYDASRTIVWCDLDA